MKKLHLGKMSQILSSYEAESIDICITDPPYGITSSAPNKPPSKKGFMGFQWDALPTQEDLSEIFRVLKRGSLALFFSNPRLDIQLEFLKRLEDCGFYLGLQPLYWVYANGVPKGLNYGKKLKDKELETYYTPNGLKPTTETILVVMKPFKEKSYTEMFKNKRIGFINTKETKINGKILRFPSNLLVANDVLSQKTKLHTSGAIKKGQLRNTNPENKTGVYNSKTYAPEMQEKKSTKEYFSDYFSIDNWWKARITNEENILPFIDISKPGKKEKNLYYTDKPLSKNVRAKGTLYNKESQFIDELNENLHPTVKPIKLMEYLVLLFTDEKQTILDPYLGSGTTIIAAEHLNRSYVGIEMNEDYFKIAKTRIKNLIKIKNANKDV